MKHIQAIVSTVICAAVLAFAVSASAQTVQQGVVTVVRIEGTARYSSGGGGWLPLTAGKTLGANDVIETASDSTVDLVLDDKAAQVNPSGGFQSHYVPINAIGSGGGAQSAPEQNVVRLQADTVLAIDKYTYSQTGADTVSDTELDLKAGKIFGNVKKISAESQYLVKMPSGVAGIRGTAFLLGSDGSVTVLSGSVVVSVVGANGQTFTTVVGAGEVFDPQTQQVIRLTPRVLLEELRKATEIVIGIREIITVNETPNGSGGDTTTIRVSPTSGNSGTIIIR